MCVVMGLIGTAAATAMGSSWQMEAESAGGNDWKAQKEAGASGGAMLAGSAADALGESGGAAVAFPRAGRYWIWVRYQRPADGAYSSFYALVRNEDGEGIALDYLDWEARLPTERPYEKIEPARRKGTKAGDWVWEKFEVTAQRPLAGTLHFGALRHGPKVAPRRIDCAILTDEAAFDPNHTDWRKVAALSGQAPHPAPAPSGYQAASGFDLTAAFFAGLTDPASQFKMGLGYNARVYVDDARMLELGFNWTHGAGSGTPQYGVRSMAAANVFDNMDPAEAKKYPSPQGRFVNAQGQVGKSWSLNFQPLQAGLDAQTKRQIEQHDNPSVETWRIAAEGGGFLDYSEPAQKAWRQWLAEQYTTIGKLNQLWGTSYKGFDDVKPPRDAQESKAAWFAFHRFSGWVLADSVARQAAAIRKVDPRHRELTEQLSNLTLLSAKFTSMRPMDWEQFINVALKDVKTVGWDSYCADDYMGCEIDLVRSLAGGRTLENQEWNTHAADPRIAARTFWTMVGKGLKGLHCFQWQEGTYHDSYPKWALLNHDFTPKAKLGAMADAAQEVHRLEPLLMAASPVHAVKPVALYYSRMDLSLAQPLASAWGEPVDTPYHVYATLRGMGYPVRWITPSEIEKGELKDISAVVLVDAQYVPRAAATKLADWIQNGGAAIADRWPGAFDEYGRPQDTLAKVFGVRAKPVKAAKGKAKSGTLALQESTQGYGEVTVAAVSGQDLPDTVGEIWQQWDSTHPVAKELGNYTLAGHGRMKIQCVAGQVIAMTFGGDPGITINHYGKGQAMYVAMMLGSLYESSATRYEWDSMHSGMAYYRLMDSFLRFAGARPSAVADLPLRLRAKLRVETPLVDDKGNALIALESFNDQPMSGFDLAVAWPAKLAAPKQLLVATDGNRRLEPVPFKSADGMLHLTMPPFDTHATILALANSGPLVGLDIAGVNRGPAGLLTVKPGDGLGMTATVYNPSPSAIPAGKVELWAPKGWFIDAASKPCPAIKPWGRAVVTFKIRAPAIGGEARLRPLVVKHTAQGKVSTPATEELWWNRPAGSPF
jgi:hypothetical protein